MGYPPKGKRSRTSQEKDLVDVPSETSDGLALTDMIRLIAVQGIEDKIASLVTRIEAMETAIGDNDSVKSVELASGYSLKSRLVN